MPKKDYTHLSKEELIAKVNALEKRKKYGLVWEEKPEAVVELCKTKLPVLKEVKSKAIVTNKDMPVNLLIEGDNYHALSALNYTHKGKIDIIYIDPPYNTGANDWKYNNNYVDLNDAYRHSKWICMMHRRLVLAKKLLTPSGFLICAIDEYEIHNIRHLLDDIFGEKNKLGMVTILHNPKGRNLSRFFSANSEYMLVYTKNADKAVFNSVALDEEVMASFDQKDDEGKYRYEDFMRVRTSWSRNNKPKNYYPIYVSKNLKELTLLPKKGYYEIYPKTKDGREWAWKNIPISFEKLNIGDYFRAKKVNDEIVIEHKYREQQVFKNVWTNKKYQSEFNGTNLLKKILGENTFNYPKSLYLLIDVLKITSNKESIILDYFAGSGTTGQAVLEINKEDDGLRRFILCTNNENNIASEICYPRIKNVINGYRNGKELIEGINGNLQYYITDFVDAEITDANKKKLTMQATGMLCIKEGTYELVIGKKKYSIFQAGKHYTGIIFDEMAIDEFKTYIKELKGNFSIYVFSLGDDTFDEEFEDIKQKVTIKPIPESILRVYRRIFK